MNSSIYCNIETLGLSVPIKFNNKYAQDIIIPKVSEKISVIRLPKYEWSASPLYNSTEMVEINADIYEEEVTVKFNCQSFGDAYSVDMEGIHWDFWKAVIATFTGALLSKNVIVSHAACIEINGCPILLPGISGGGKSSISFECMRRGLPVYASELCYLKEGEIIAGNLSASIDSAALEYFGMPIPKVSEYKENRVLVDTTALLEQKKIERVYFPKVTNSGLHVRQITIRRGRMLLYENIFGQLPSGQLLCHNSIPILPAPTSKQLEVVAKQVDCLLCTPPFIVEGSPSEIVDWFHNESNK